MTTKGTIFIGNQGYELYNNILLEFDEAKQIYISLQSMHQGMSMSMYYFFLSFSRTHSKEVEKQRKTWSNLEIHFLQWLVFNYCEQQEKNQYQLVRNSTLE